MRVLFLSTDEKVLNHFSTVRYLQERNHEVSVYLYRKHSFYKRHFQGNNIYKGTMYRFVRDYDEDLLEEIRVFKPDLVFVIKGEIYHPRFWKKAKSLHPFRLVNWFADDPQLFHLVSKHIAPAYDLFFINPKGVIPLYQRHGFHHVHAIGVSYFDEAFYSPFLKSEPPVVENDILFIGTCYLNRAIQFGKICNAFKGKRIRIIGPLWRYPSRILGYGNVYDSGRYYYEDYFHEIRKTSIFINPPMTPRHINDKVYETMSLKVFAIHGMMDELDSLFEEGKEIVTYGSTKELLEKTRYYLENPLERQGIVERAFRKVSTHHTTQTRMREMSAIISEKLNLIF